MSRVTELIDLIVQGRNTEAGEVLNTELLSRSYSAVNEIKPDVAAAYFSGVTGETGEGEEIDTTDSE
jgi:hypothetical protein